MAVNEYLIVIERETSLPLFSFCNSVERFNEYLQETGELSIVASSLEAFGSKFQYSVRRGVVKGKNQIFFHLTLSVPSHDDAVAAFKSTIKVIKSLLIKGQAIVETIRDEISFRYSQEAYALIHNVENLMRKFITYFMITNVGKDWVEESSPEVIRTALIKSKRKNYGDVLQQLDFIHLGEFLFKPYQRGSVDSLFKAIETAPSMSDELFDLLRASLPRSNWDKFFSASVDCSDEYLKSRWVRLYDLRNIIAHTSSLTEGDLTEIKRLCGDVATKLNAAFERIDEIDIPSAEREVLSEEIALSAGGGLDTFLPAWRRLEALIRVATPGVSHSAGLGTRLSQLRAANAINEETYRFILEVGVIRNGLVHGLIAVDEVKLSELEAEIADVAELLKPTWRGEVVSALVTLGGQGTLDEIYDVIEQRGSRDLPESWRSAVRKTIYLHSSDADAFLGKDDIFKNVSKGIWALRRQ